MKFPLVFRSRHEAGTARLMEENARVAEQLAQVIATRTQDLRRIDQLVQLCEARLRDIEDLQAAVIELRKEPARERQLVQLCEARLRDIEKLQTAEMELRRSRTKILDQLTDARIAAAPYRGPAIPVVLGFDLEPDARVVDLDDPSWRGAVSLFSRLPEFRKQLEAIAGNAPVRFSWFPRADPGVGVANGRATWAFEHFAEEWRAVAAAGDEIGLHMHPWRWDTEAGGWYQDFADEEWLAECLRTSISAFREFFGATPASYRTGDRFLTNAMVRLLEQEGVRVDLTLERLPEGSHLPESERHKGAIPDATRVPLRAFYPSSSDFRVPSPDKTSGLGMLPLTSFNNSSLNPWLPNTLFEAALEQLLDGPETLTHLAFVARSDIIDRPEWGSFVENSLSLARRVREGRLIFLTASEAWDQISAQGLSVGC